jgi:hypothetical protein
MGRRGTFVKSVWQWSVSVSKWRKNFENHIRANEIGPHMALNPMETASIGHMAISLVRKVYFTRIANERCEGSVSLPANQHAVISHG